VSRPEPASEPSARRRRWGGAVGDRIRAVLSRPRLADVDWEQLEEALLAADVGVEASEEILEGLRRRLAADRDADAREALAAEILGILDPAARRALDIGSPGDGAAAPVVVVGVNGVGKTTTLGKLARLLVDDGYSVVIGAADTFRAAAADQVATWGARVGVEVVRADRDGADAASVAFAAADRARETGADVLLVDTAGRLQNKRDLMDELGKTLRVLSRTRPIAETLLVLDATTGQNGLAQARVFAEVASITGIVLAKLDGSARGGVVVPVQRELGVPVKYAGLGEGVDDLVPFDPEAFVAGLLG
jgi:fused signal recognition particle receptor